MGSLLNFIFQFRQMVESLQGILYFTMKYIIPFQIVYTAFHNITEIYISVNFCYINNNISLQKTRITIN